jgi:hypothetical protein
MEAGVPTDSSGSSVQPGLRSTFADKPAARFTFSVLFFDERFLFCLPLDFLSNMITSYLLEIKHRNEKKRTPAAFPPFSILF